MDNQIYEFPKMQRLIKDDENSQINLEEKKKEIEDFFHSFNINIECKNLFAGINFVTYVIDLKYKTRVSTIKALKEDIKLKFGALDVQFQVSINETPYLGIHIIKNKDKILLLGNLIQDDKFIKTNKKIPIILGKDFNNDIIIEDLCELPHLLVAGTTGTGKSTLLSTFIVDMIYKIKPSELKLVLVDSRCTNFSRFNKIPHMLIPTVTDANKAIGLLNFLIQEMNNRYSLFSKNKVDNIESYNEKANLKLPRIVAIIEDFYDLMLSSNGQIEQYVQRLIQMSRAAGMHLIISTQRPSTKVITGTIKANIPSRIAFRVPSQIDSKTIIDVAGAEELLIYGDVFFTKIGEPIKRIQTPYITDKEIEEIVEDVSNYSFEYDDTIIESVERNISNENKDEEYDENEEDPLLLEAIRIVLQTGQASTSFLQRNLQVGYARAERIIDQMEEKGIISEYKGSKPREILMTYDEWIEKNKGK